MNSKDRSELRAQAHHLEPVLRIGKQGATEAFLKAFNAMLDTHGLVKIKLVDLKDQRLVIRDYLCEKTSAEIVSVIGNTMVFYRESKESGGIDGDQDSLLVD